MSSELSLKLLLDAINDIKGEIAGLASGLRSAEEKIARLEAATYTPPECPSSPIELPANIHLTPASALSKRANPSADAPEDGESQPRDEQLSANLCSEDPVCDMKRHLQPLSDGIAALTMHVLRIERTMGRPDLDHSSITSETTPQSPHSVKNTESLQQGQGDTQELLLLNKLPGRRGSISKSLGISAATPPPVFGQISTPRRRIVSLNVAGSPFGNYVEEESPFSQLARPIAGQSSVLIGKTSLLRDDATTPTVPFFASPSSSCIHEKPSEPFGGNKSIRRKHV